MLYKSFSKTNVSPVWSGPWCIVTYESKTKTKTVISTSRTELICFFFFLPSFFFLIIIFQNSVASIITVSASWNNPNESEKKTICYPFLPAVSIPLRLLELISPWNTHVCPISGILFKISNRLPVPN